MLRTFTLAALLFSTPALAELALPEAPGILVPVTPTQPAAVVAEFNDKVMFGDKDTLHGSLVSFIDGKLTWRHKDGAAPFQFKASNMDCVELGNEPKVSSGDDMRVTMNNGDVLYGKLVEFTREKTIVDTGYAGRLTIPSNLVCSLAPVKSANNVLLDGFGKPEDWKAGNGIGNQTKIANGKMTLTNNVWVGRELELPTKFRLEVEMPASQPQFQIGFLKDNNQPWGGNGYTLQSNNGYCYVMQCKTGGNRGNQQQQIGNFQTKVVEGKCTFVLVGDLDAKLLVLSMNGQKLTNINVPTDLKIGKWLILSGQGADTTFSKFKVSEWSGSIESALNGTVKRVPMDMLVLANKDQVSGEILSIKGGKTSFKTEFASMDVPLDKITRVDLSVQFNHAQKKSKDDVQLFFNDSDRLTLTLSNTQNGKLMGRSDALGEMCGVDLLAVKKLVFNLDAPFRGDVAVEEASGDGDENTK